MAITPDWVTAWATVAAAVGSLSVVLVALFGSPFNHPRLSIMLQREGGSGKIYWHESSISPSAGAFSRAVQAFQLRIWVVNAGRRAAKNCRVKLAIVELGAQSAMDATTLTEFTLPAFLYYKPRTDESTGLLAAPDPGEMSVDVPAHSKEAYELLFYRVGLAVLCYPYSKAGHPLAPNKKYVLKLRAYADETKPSLEESFLFEWSGTVQGLSTALKPA